MAPDDIPTTATGGSALVVVDGEDRVEFTSSLSIGRHLLNDLVLGHPRISGRHAVIEWEDDGWRIRDVGSRNGTSVNGRRIRGDTPLKVDDVIRFGGAAAWKVAQLAPPPELAGVVAVIEIVASARRIPVETDRFLVGTGLPCDLVVPEWLGEGRPAIRVVLYEEKGAVWITPADGLAKARLDGEPWRAGEVCLDRELALRLGPTELRLIPIATDALHAPTERAGRRSKEYDLDLHLAFIGPSEGSVRVVHDAGEWSFSAKQRFILMYLLARAGGEWVPDEELRVQLWGKAGSAEVDRSALHKLIHDIRQVFLSNGIDGWFIEKKYGTTRLRLPSGRIHLAEFERAT